MAVAWLRTLASQAPVPVFPVPGLAFERVVTYLALAPRINLVHSPRHASILLICGAVPPHLHAALRRVHDQIPPPSATLWFQASPLPELSHDHLVEDLDLLEGALVTTYKDLMTGRLPPSPDLVPDEPPSRWQGMGEHGQGGEGMMGGVPYGRPMAMNMHEDLRDGLRLDSLSLTLGPFHPVFPPGLVAELRLQGDVIQSWTTVHAPHHKPLERVFAQARAEPVPIARLELSRARYHLRRLFFGLRLAGLDRLALCALRLAAHPSPSPAQIRKLHQRLKWSGFFMLSATGGQLTVADAREIGGVAARAAGLGEDQRSHDSAYQRLGFHPIVTHGGTTAARWEQTLAEIQQSLVLAREADQQRLYADHPAGLETPRGPWVEDLPRDASHLLENLMPGREWDEAMTMLASLDLAGASDPETAPAGASGSSIDALA